MSHNLKDMTGQKFGKLRVLARARPDHRSGARWACVCDCGGFKIVYGPNLRQGDTTSCGCVHKAQLAARNFIHGAAVRADTKSEFRIWCDMQKRCYCKTSSGYQNYGGRGIDVCRRWQKSFEDFYRDMGPRPSKRHSIERVENNLGYSPENCIWATPETQANNNRRSVRVTFRGQTKLLKVWCELLGLNRAKVRQRLYKGWSPEAALTP